MTNEETEDTHDEPENVDDDQDDDQDVDEDQDQPEPEPQKLDEALPPVKSRKAPRQQPKGPGMGVLRLW